MRNRSHKLRLDLIFFGFVTMFIVACRSQRPAVQDIGTDSESQKVGLTEILENTTTKFHTLKTRKADVNFSLNGERDKVKGNLAIYRDSMIVVSVIPALGYEVLRILCTKDSVIIINRPEKSYSTVSFEYFRQLYNIPIGYMDIQAILANEVFYYKIDYKDRVFKRQLTDINGKNIYMVDAFRDGKKIANQGFEINGGRSELQKVSVVDSDEKMRMNISYEDFLNDTNIRYPRGISIEVIHEQNRILLELSMGEVVFNDSINVKFAIPSHYDRKELLN